MSITLPNDGASFPCSFHFEEWRCERKATTALSEEHYIEIKEELVGSKISISGRALCSTHYDSIVVED